MNDNENYIVKIKTVQISAFKILIESLKEIFRDLVFKISGNNESINQKGCISVSELNSKSDVFVKLKLPAEKFEEFYFNSSNGENSISIGVNMGQFYKLMKTMSNDDNLTLYIEKNKLNVLGIILSNAKKKYITHHKLTLLDVIKEECRPIPESKFKFVITMLSQDFHNLIKNMSVIADNVDIKYIDIEGTRDTLIFSCEGNYASQETKFVDYIENENQGLKNINENDKIEKQALKIIHENNDGCTNQIIQGVYQLKTLNLFSKCSSLSNNLEIYMKDNFPLVIKYMIANLGHVYIILSSIQEKDEYMNNSDSYDSESDE